MNDPIYQLFLYNDWANKTLITSLKRHAEAIPPACLNLLSHIVNAQMIWSGRINGDKPTLGVWELHTLAECETYHDQSSSILQQKINSADIEKTAIINYTNTKNDRFSNALQDILLHVFNHGSYHRAQIATELKKNGISPINTDYITFARIGLLPNSG